MKKLLLCILLSLVLTQQPKCKVYESYDQKIKKCKKVCELNEYFNEETFTCEVCNDGETYNSESKQCEKKEEEDKKEDPEINPGGKPDKNEGEDNNGKCKGGIMLNGICICGRGKKLVNGECKKSDNVKCKGGKMLNGRCVCGRGKKLVNGECKNGDNGKCKGGRMVRGRCVCSRGKRNINGECKNDGKDKKCPPGTVKKGNKCEKKCVGKQCRPKCKGRQCGRPKCVGRKCGRPPICRNCGAVQKNSESILKLMFNED